MGGMKERNELTKSISIKIDFTPSKNNIGICCGKTDASISIHINDDDHMQQNLYKAESFNFLDVIKRLKEVFEKF